MGYQLIPKRSYHVNNFYWIFNDWSPILGLPQYHAIFVFENKIDVDVHVTCYINILVDITVRCDCIDILK